MQTYTPQECLDRAAAYERDAANLEAQYGSGVRPSWVSTDISIARERARQYREAARGYDMATE
jgi:hypothetical protein